jgi:hypothetical protein
VKAFMRLYFGFYLLTKCISGCYDVNIHLNQNNMPGGSKVERNSVSDQPHEIKYEADKMDIKSSDIRDAKKGGSNQRKDIENKVR